MPTRNPYTPPKSPVYRPMSPGESGETDGGTNQTTTFAAPAKTWKFVLAEAVQQFVRRGKSDCGLVHHYESTPKDDRETYGPHVRPALDRVYKAMLPGKTASCACEMKACEAQWENKRQEQYTTEYVMAGSYTKGVPGHCKAGEPIKKVWHVPYSLGPDQFSTVAKDFPGYFFVTGEEHHSSPVSHTRAVLTSNAILRKSRPGKYLDLYGHPGKNAQPPMGLDIETTVERCTPDDFIRAATKWGNWENDPKVTEKSLRDLTLTASDETKAWIGKFDGFYAFHTLYYAQQNELARLLGLNKKAVLKGTVHRFPEDRGTLNNGELKYEKTIRMGMSWVRQTSGRKVYDHRDTDWLFDHNAWTDGVDGMAWTLDEMVDGTFEVTMVHCPPSQARMSPRCCERKQSGPLVNIIDDQDDGKLEQIGLKKLAGVRDIVIGGHTIEVTVKASKTFEQMRLHASGKARTPNQFKEHLSATKRTLKANKEQDDAARVAMASFLVDFECDKQLTLDCFNSVRADSIRYDKVLAGLDPNSTLGIADKVLAIGIGLSSLGPAGGKQSAAALRLAREFLV